MQQKTALAILALLLVVGFLGFLGGKRAEAPEQVSNLPSMKFKLTSPAFTEGAFIPSKYTCDELNISPPLEISGVPEGTKSLVLVMDDPDVPKSLRADGYFDHWTLYAIPPTTTSIGEGEFSGTFGLNGAGKSGYTGPCPPTEYQPTTHRYFFTLYATDLSNLNFFVIPTKSQVLQAIQGHIIEKTTLMGRYDRLKTSREND